MIIECTIIILIAVQQTSTEILFSLYSNSSKFLDKRQLITERDEIHFFLYTRENKRQEIITNNVNTLFSSQFNFNYTTKIIIHGWLPRENTTKALNNLIKAYLQNTTCNVIALDWKALANGQFKTAHQYFNVVTNVLIDFLKFLFVNGVSTTQVHLIGHCIGAHIAGRAGKYFREHTNTLIDAITGLDPAFPKFKFTSEDQRLGKYDAAYIEVVHTNGGYWGIPESIGQVDFFINGGSMQPGCLEDETGICAHERVIWYYAYSIMNTKPYFAQRFWIDDTGVHYSGNTDIVFNGIKLCYGKEGTYYFRADGEIPFHQYEEPEKLNNTST